MGQRLDQPRALRCPPHRARHVCICVGVGLALEDRRIWIEEAPACLPLSSALEPGRITHSVDLLPDLGPTVWAFPLPRAGLTRWVSGTLPLRALEAYRREQSVGGRRCIGDGSFRSPLEEYREIKSDLTAKVRYRALFMNG